MSKCECKKSSKYFDAEGRSFNVLNKMCPIHAPILAPSTILKNKKKIGRYKMTNEMRVFIMSTLGMGSKECTDEFNKKFNLYKHTSYISNARFRCRRYA